MMAWITSPEIWFALLTLSTLEIVLGVDNLVFISIAVSKLPPAKRPKARRFGLALACVSRIMLLVSLGACTVPTLRALRIAPMDALGRER
jgi:predicted tellurium resistance membrane protein TerC